MVRDSETVYSAICPRSSHDAALRMLSYTTTALWKAVYDEQISLLGVVY